MKRYILLIFIIIFSFNCYAQVIKGTVRDQKTKEAIYSASVYFNGTIGGTLTDQNGKFELDVSKYGKMPLTISALGYFSLTVNDFNTGKPLEILLNPKVFELEEVVVKAKSHSWERRENLIIFRREFLGTTGNSFNCKIINEPDIKFIYTSQDTVKAYALKPILIQNKALGYNITYYLDNFEFIKASASFSFRGNAIFSEDTVGGESKKIFYDRKRKETYLGSRMHFFRALWIDDLNSAGFTVKNSANETLGSKKIVLQADSRTKYLRYTGSDLGIAYYSKVPASNIIFIKDKVYFDANGYFDPSGIIWEGEMAKKRIADLLPFDYVIQ